MFKYLLDSMIYQDYLNQDELLRYASAMNARAKRSKSKGILTADLLRDRIFESGGRCEWCGVDLLNQDFELDHVQSLSHQGHNTATNLVVACPDCNRRKSGKHPARFASEIYSETGRKTPLLDRVLHDYDITLTSQKSLFDTDSTAMDIQIDPDDSSNPPPYRWT